MRTCAADDSLRSEQLGGCGVVVLGGGISGLTTALVLQLLGVDTVLVSEKIPLQEGTPGDPSVPTAFAMATAYPHDLRVYWLSQITARSQSLFAYLSQLPSSGVVRYRMFEVFEHEPDPAPHGQERLNFQEFDGRVEKLKTSINPPCRPAASYLWGWRFDTFFADMPVYLRFLWSLYRERGGRVLKGRVTAANLDELLSDRVVINCLGAGAIDVACDSAVAVMMRGRQVTIAGAPLIKADDGVPLAFNYTPPAQVFSRANGQPEYVHFFARSDGWVLGQTREPGTMDASGSWTGAAVLGKERLIAGCAIPAAIIDLNREILQAWKQVSWPRTKAVGRMGMRYYRDPQGSGVRLEADRRGAGVLIHNYGHGGSGVTVSWGCALRCAELYLQHADGAVSFDAGGLPGLLQDLMQGQRVGHQQELKV